MGAKVSIETKLTDEQYKRWLRIKKEKIDELENESNKKQLEIDTRKNNMINSFLDYTETCHDVPKLAMVIPRYRNLCQENRMKFLEPFGDVIGSNDQKDLINSVKKIVENS